MPLQRVLQHPVGAQFTKHLRFWAGVAPRFHRGRRPGLADERGFTLVEELVALTVLSLGIVLILAMVSTGMLGSKSTADHVTAEALARSQLEVIKGAAYQPDPTAVPYPTVAAPAGHGVSTTVEHWDPVAADFTGTVDSGLQKITVSVSRGSDVILSLEGYKVDR